MYCTFEGVRYVAILKPFSSLKIQETNTHAKQCSFYVFVNIFSLITSICLQPVNSKRSAPLLIGFFLCEIVIFIVLC